MSRKFSLSSQGQLQGSAIRVLVAQLLGIMKSLNYEYKIFIDSSKKIN